VFLDPDAFLEIRVVHRAPHPRRRAGDGSRLGAYGQVAGRMDSHLDNQGRKGAPRTAHFTVEKAEARRVEDRIFAYPEGTIAREIPRRPRGAARLVRARPRRARPASFDEGVISGSTPATSVGDH